MDDIDDVIKDFLIESHEGLDQVERDLVALEEGESPELVARIFRAIHTLKGTCGFLGMSKLERLAHTGENLLSKIRDGELQNTPARTTALLSMSDAVREILQNVEATGEEGETDYSALERELTRLQTPDGEADDGDAAGGEATGGEADDGEADDGEADDGETDDGEADDGEADDGEADDGEADDGEAAHAAELLGEAAAAPAADSRASSTPKAATVAEKPAAPAEPTAARPSLSVVPAPAAGSPGEPKAAAPADVPAPAADPPKPPEARPTSVSDGVVRVGVDLLDDLMNLVGELVLVRNQILQHAHRIDDAAFGATSQRLSHVTTELQEGVMKTRMQPIGNVWSKFPRVVRDLARACEKQVRIEMDGRQTELDRTIIEAIKDPLTHLVRNAVDHGIETPAARSAAGKAPEGTLLLRAFHEGGQVNIEIADDGGGIRADKIRARCVERGLLTESQASRLSDREAMQMIFQPGFSTAAKVTNVSGRGVGMDVVKTNIERIGGTIDVQSSPGEGTSFKIKIPLTLAIIPALVVRSGGARYAIPQVSLLELVRLEGDQLGQIETIQGTRVLRLRGDLLPLVDLADALGIEPQREDDAVNVVVLQADDTHFGLVVEATHDTEEIVVKPLGKELKHIDAFAGATIMGDGRVALILDVLGLAQRAALFGEERGRLREQAAEPETRSADAQTLLLVESVQERPLAVPLAMVDRLEEIPVERVERAGPHDVVRYRGEILPLVHLSRMLYAAGPRGDGETYQVFVVSHEGKRVGLVVERLLDIVEAPLSIEPLGERRGVLGSAIVQDRVVEVVDVAACVRAEMAPRHISSAAWADAAE